MMRLPPVDNRPAEWPSSIIDVWVQLKEKAALMESAAGNSDAFELMVQRFREMARTGRFDGLALLLKRRMAARALTALWATDRDYGMRLFNDRILHLLVEAQQPRLTRLTLVQLLQLYFALFDELDNQGDQPEAGLRNALQRHIEEQLSRLPERLQHSLRKDIVSVLGAHPWLLQPDAPLRLVQLAQAEGCDFNQAITQYGLDGFDSGRYGDICRAHYYLETLRTLNPGEHDPVLDELLKPSVSKAPYQGEIRIGHAALEIMIDRISDEPGDVWQNFIVSLAGDPRIASSTAAYREWWHPLGDERIAKVRGWLSREDLKLFLQAVEQYGIESDNDELQRMFPARKVFLEGLFKLKLIRGTRLLLGGRAEQSVRRILGKEVRTSFAKMDGGLTDKAVIYLDCGDFYLVEGSHSFKIWVYMAPPSDMLTSYQRTTFSHSDLTSRVPADYRRTYPTLPYDSFVHNASWQAKVFSFLADNGIGLDMEQLLRPEDYRHQLQRFGIPTVNARQTLVPLSGVSNADLTELAVINAQEPEFEAAQVTTQSSKTHRVSAENKKLSSTVSSVLLQAGSDRAHKIIHPTLTSEPATESSEAVPDPDTGSGATSSSPERIVISGPLDLESLSPIEVSVLRYFSDNPGDKPTIAANILGIELREINSALSVRLKPFVQRVGYGWHLKSAAQTALQILDSGEMPSALRSERLGEGDVAMPFQMRGDSASSANAAEKLTISTILNLSREAVSVLRAIASEPGCRVHYIAQRVNMPILHVNDVVANYLQLLVIRDDRFAWYLTNDARPFWNEFERMEEDGEVLAKDRYGLD